ncbi:MAG: TonB-dependent receptor [Henriciella sp.]|nr:TonB-dependent receptor [Henriciella sp.]
MSLKRALLISAASIAVSGLAGLPAMAQTNGDADARRLEPVVTTAQRVEQDAQDVPVSITTVSGEKLDNIKAGGADIRFLSARAPSVIAESSFGRAFPRFYIRGIGNTDFDLNSSQPVSLVYDDVPYENPILKGFPVFDVEGIEVLRGPQGTLFGRNTPGGIIKFDSVKPGDDLNGYARASVGSYATTEVEGAVGFRVNDNLALRFSGLVQQRDDFVDNRFTGEENAFEGFEETAARVQALWSPVASTDILLNVHGRNNDSDARLFRANIIDQGSRGLSDDFDFDTVFFDGQNELKQESFGVTLRVDHEIDDSVDLTYVYGYETADVFSRGDIDGGFGAAFLGAGNFGPGFIPFPSESAGGVDDLTQMTHELRVAYDNGGPIRAQAGFFIFDERVNISSFSFDTLGPGQPVNGAALRNQDTDSTGIFASVAYDVSEQLTLAGGVRFTDEEKEFTAGRSIGPFGSGALAPRSVTVGDDQISWDVSATYQYSEDISYYAKIARGFRGPSVQGRLVFGNTISDADSETVLSYEAGVKSELYDNRIRANANVFLYTLEDQQLTIVGGLDNTVALFNADESQGYGFEADVEALVTDNLVVTGGLSYNNTEIKDDVLLSPGCGAGCTVLDPEVVVDGQTFFNISGNSFPNAPEWIANVTARYGIPYQGGELYVFTDWAYKGDTNFFLYESVEFAEDGYWLGGLRAGWEGDNGVALSAFVRNLTDELVLEGAIDFNNLTGFVNEPRTWGIELGYKF